MASKNHCCVPNCQKIRADENVILHSFPDPDKEPERFRAWKNAVGQSLFLIDHKFIYTNRRVCHDHFEKQYLTWTRRLTHNAVPTLCIPGTSSKFKKSKEKHGQSSTLHADVTQAELNLAAEDPLMVQREYAMEVDQGEDSDQDEDHDDHNDIDDHGLWRVLDDDSDAGDVVPQQVYKKRTDEKTSQKQQSTREEPRKQHDQSKVLTRLQGASETQRVQITLQKQHVQGASQKQHVEDVSLKWSSQAAPLEQDAQDASENNCVQSASEKHHQNTSQYGKEYSTGQCRCCLKIGLHCIIDIGDVLECLNVRVSRDPRMQQLVCATCGKFLQQARRFRDMVLASERKLLSKLDIDSDILFPAPGPRSDTDTSVRDDYFIQQSTNTEDETERCEEREAGLRQIPACGGTQHEVPDGGTRRGAFSQLSDYSDFIMDTKENDETFRAKNIQELLQSMRKEQAKLTVSIRENLITLLDHSTILPFASRRGDKFECIYCDGGFSRVDQLRAHVEEKHRNEETAYKHDILKIIPQTVVRADVSRIQCRLCGMDLDTVDNLVEHLVKVHRKTYHNLNLDPPHNIIPFNLTLDVWKCLECGRTFKTFTKLRMHVNKHFGNFLCHQCGSKFLYHNHYSQHVKQHHQTNSTKICDVCGKRFKTKKELIYHHSRNHFRKPAGNTEKSQLLEEETLRTVYECVICHNGTRFTDLQAAYMHRIGHLNNTREGPFICEICEYSSLMKTNFKRHLQSHYSVKNYECGVCKKTFRKSNQLSDHMNIHLKMRFRCPLCDSTLSSKIHLKRHVKNLHSDITVEISI